MFSVRVLWGNRILSVLFPGWSVLQSGLVPRSLHPNSSGKHHSLRKAASAISHPLLPALLQKCPSRSIRKRSHFRTAWKQQPGLFGLQLTIEAGVWKHVGGQQVKIRQSEFIGYLPWRTCKLSQNQNVASTPKETGPGAVNDSPRPLEIES